jgi:superfamily II DNA or RNA helicase
VITVVDGQVQVALDHFDQEGYDLFLRAKKLPEKQICFDHEADTYKIVAPERFAHILDSSLRLAQDLQADLASHLFDYQRWIVERALQARRYAVWADTGLGKTAIFLEWARQVSQEGPVLIFSPLRIIDQTIEEAERFYGEQLRDLRNRAELTAWLESAAAGVAITNIDKLAKGELPLRRCAGIVLDESSILKTGGGTIKWNLIHSAKGIPYKLSLTATPAPNDTMEYASQASFLEKLRDEGEILWTYFTRDKYGNWRVKPHARDAFYAFMSGWSIYLRDPAAYGFEPILDTLPDPEYFEHRIPITDEQRVAMQELLTTSGKGLFDTTYGVRERSKLAQIARGFLYEGTGRDRIAKAVASRKPALVARLVSDEVDEGRPTIVWTNFDEESEILAGEIRQLRDDLKVAELSGSTSEEATGEVIHGFRRGDVDVLVTKAQLVGFGLNFQRCKAMVFSGIDDSFERRYQAVRRAYRFGQRDTVHVHLPHVPELEGLMVEKHSGEGRAVRGRRRPGAAQLCEGGAGVSERAAVTPSSGGGCNEVDRPLADACPFTIEDLL